MSDFAAADLLAIAKVRYSEQVLRYRMLGASDDAGRDEQLLDIAVSVVDRVRAAALVQVGWPLPGVWPIGEPNEGTAYRVLWPANLLQKALELFNWRTLQTADVVSTNQRKIGEAAEGYFENLEGGGIGFGVGFGFGDVSSPAPIAARNRDGTSNLETVSDRRNLLGGFDELAGAGWDWVR